MLKEQNPSQKDYEKSNTRLIKKLRKKMGYVAIVMMVAEEAGEVIQAVSKFARATKLIFSPTPVRNDEAAVKLLEEVCDLLNALWLLGYDPIVIAKTIVHGKNEKLRRLDQRIKEAEAEENEAETIGPAGKA